MTERMIASSHFGIWRMRAFVAILLGATAAAAQDRPARSASPSYGTAATTPASLNSLDPASVALGRKLFFDTSLSADGWLSCASCHDPSHGFSDPRRLSIGVQAQRSKRHAPTLLGRGQMEAQFWDGRAATLEEQVLQPILNPEEMGMTMDAVLRQLNREGLYRGLTRESLAKALASYVSSIRSENTRYDLFVSGWPIVMSDQELEGLRLFRGKAQCYLCHSGMKFTDEAFHNTGVAWREGKLQDSGRGAITGKPYHQGAFKTPTLREAGSRGPYMHDGSLATLEEVIEFYDRGGNANPYLDENIVPLHLSAGEKKALLAFLRNGLKGTIHDGNEGASANPAKRLKGY